MKHLLFFYLMAVPFFANSATGMNAKEFDETFKLLPKPKKIEIINGTGISFTSLHSICLKGTDKPVLYGFLKSLPLSKKAGPGVLVLIMEPAEDLPDSPEGYLLENTNGEVTIRSKTPAGLFYGCQTLFQLLEDARDQEITVPACRIVDYPDIAYRAIHVDLKHHLDAGHYYYDIIDRLAKIKINAIIVEFEDKLRYRKAAVIGSGDAVSVEEFAAISRYAHERNIEISPLVQGLGHASFILKHEEYKKLRDDSASDWSFDALNPKTYDLQFSLYEDAIAATPYGKYLHVGGDEVGNLGMSALSKKSGLTALQLQMQWLNRVSEFARLHHRIPIFWDDMLFKLAGLYQTTWDPEVPAEQVKKIWGKNEPRLEDNLGLFPKECIYMRWNYDHPEIIGNHKAIDWYKSHNLKVMAATGAQTMWPMLPRNQSNFQSIKDFCQITSEKKLEGILCTAWDDCSPHFETYWRGFYDFAFFSWNYNDAKRDEVHAIFRHRFYAPALIDSSFEFQDLLEKALGFWETALIEKGHRNNYPATIDLIELPNPDQPEAWSEKYKKKLSGAEAEISRYGVIENRIDKAMQLARRNQYALELMNQINELQIYSAKLLLLLHQYDKTLSAAVKQNIKKYVNGFAEIRKKYENVFSRTRILSNPADYILDQNQHHHLANGTVNDDWMFVYELAINKKINDWLGR